MHYGLTWNLLPLLAALAVINGAGSLLARVLVAGSKAAGDRAATSAGPRRRAWGWSFLLGTALVGIVLQIPLAINGHISKYSFGGTLLLCAAMTLVELGLRWRDRKNERPCGSTGHSGTHGFWGRMLGWVNDLPLAPRAITLLCVGIALWFSTIEPTIIFDARSAFGLKAKILYDTGDLTGEDFREVDRVHFNANYPLLVSLIEATLFTAQGSDQNVGLQLLFAGFVLACASVLIEEIARFERPAWAATWGICFLLMPLTISPIEGGGISGGADFPLAAFATAGVIAAGRLFAGANFRSAILAGLMLGAATLTKQEGMIWLLAVGAAVVATIVLRRRWRQKHLLTTVAATGGIAFGCAALAVINHRGIPNSPYFRNFQDAMHWDWLMHTLHRPVFILKFASKKLLSSARFTLIWPFMIVALLLLRRPQTTATVTFWRATAALMAAGYFAVFMISPLHLEYQLRTAFLRLVVQFLPVTMLVAAEQLQASGWSGEMGWILTDSTPDIENHVKRIPTHVPDNSGHLSDQSSESRAA